MNQVFEMYFDKFWFEEKTGMEEGENELPQVFNQMLAVGLKRDDAGSFVFC